LKFAENQTEELCLLAVNKQSDTLCFVRNEFKTPAVLNAADERRKQEMIELASNDRSR